MSEGDRRGKKPQGSRDQISWLLSWERWETMGWGFLAEMIKSVKKADKAKLLHGFWSAHVE